MALEVGSRLGHYDVTALIGEGGMGEVYRAIAVGVMLVVLASSGAQGAQDEWEVADRATRRLAPAQVAGLPEGVRSYLEGLGCTIPVPAWGDGLTNVARGEFRQAGRADWAVLCSIDRISRILVFWNGDPVHVAVLAEQPDRDYLQRDETGRPVFSRALETADPQCVRRKWEAGDPPEMVHAGIEDHFLGKASMIYYYESGQWIELLGAD